jgi:Pyruvate kinase
MRSGARANARRQHRARHFAFQTAGVDHRAEFRFAACQNLAFSYGVYPINLAEEPDDWREWIARWLRENGMTAEQVMLVAGPSPRNPKANYRIELMRWTRRMGERQTALK